MVDFSINQKWRGDNEEYVGLHTTDSGMKTSEDLNLRSSKMYRVNVSAYLNIIFILTLILTH